MLGALPLAPFRTVSLLGTSVNMAKRKGRGTQPRPRPGGTSIRSGATSPSAQASRLARLAVVGCQAIARAALVPEDVRPVSEDRVADDGVVGGRRPSEALDHDHPAGEARGPGWNVMDYVVPFNLHTPSPEQRDADSGERRGIFEGRACARVVRYLVTSNAERARGTRRIGEEQHPQAVVVHFVADDLAMEC